MIHFNVVTWGDNERLAEEQLKLLADYARDELGLTVYRAWATRPDAGRGRLVDVEASEAV